MTTRLRLAVRRELERLAATLAGCGIYGPPLLVTREPPGESRHAG